MSLPFTRRIARAALLVAAGAAPLVGAAGTAGAVELPKTTGLDGVNTIDAATVGKTLGSASSTATKPAGATSGKALKTAMPPAGKTLRSAGLTASPTVAKKASPVAAKKAFGKTTQASGSLVGMTAKSLTGGAQAPTSFTQGISANQLPGGKLAGKGFPLA